MDLVILFRLFMSNMGGRGFVGLKAVISFPSLSLAVNFLFMHFVFLQSVIASSFFSPLWLKLHSSFASREIAWHYQLSAHLHFVSDSPDVEILFWNKFFLHVFDKTRGTVGGILVTVNPCERCLFGFKLYILINVQDACFHTVIF